MLIRCTFSVPLQRIRVYTREVSEVSSLPEYIIKRGPYIKEAPGTSSEIIIIYEFDKAKIAEVWEYISKQLDILHGIPGFTFSAHILEEGKEVRRVPIKLDGQGVTKPFSQHPPTFE